MTHHHHCRQPKAAKARVGAIDTCNCKYPVIVLNPNFKKNSDYYVTRQHILSNPCAMDVVSERGVACYCIDSLGLKLKAIIKIFNLFSDFPVEPFCLILGPSPSNSSQPFCLILGLPSPSFKTLDFPAFSKIGPPSLLHASFFRLFCSTQVQRIDLKIFKVRPVRHKAKAGTHENKPKQRRKIIKAFLCWINPQGGSFFLFSHHHFISATDDPSWFIKSN